MSAASLASSCSRYFTFGVHKIPEAHTFRVSKHCYSFVNLKPIVEGHVLVSSKRRVVRLHELTQEEHIDLWNEVRLVSKVIENAYGAHALNISLQDGQAAGQSVQHVHVHILPRKPEDFEENDEVYERLEEFEFENSSKKNSALRVPSDDQRRHRSFEEMAEEATRLSKLFV
mmetsp:Transcript_16070/g.19519  ORF Transcript_16070/g.19519 Transcript_16070/m.19519 type:complete len:172 (-) Transcript_16070:413-928(-)|eukprot:CAMPEP_0184013764 /NCGR_PEP_ID=MMETSP0954-20121128/5212_1 /TAXON_ID=627963 /ORGANISM="Aplanochytrium sp, Strain PBS07" /LENGTH=171 /DNA_ID=CAMNT_0026294025 /DNA_START=285 /DNA_END=800 /DNA_ORIENTATION=+